MKYKERLFLKKLQIWQYYNHCLKNWIELNYKSVISTVDCYNESEFPLSILII